MSSFFGKLKSQNAPAPAVGTTPMKRDPNAPVPTPLERMLKNAGPLRNDGSDKFFGMENFGNTCYCNSILQCLYYSVPFREHVLSYPRHSTPESIAEAQAHAPPRVTPSQANGAAKKPPGPSSSRNAGAPPQQQKPEDKDSPEYKKKQALAAGPILNMSYGNARSYDMPENLFTTLKDLFEAVVVDRNRMGVISPIKFLNTLRKENEMFRSAMHQDAHEFLNLLLNTVLENIEEHDRTLNAQKLIEQTQLPVEEPESMITKNDSATVSFPPVLPTPTTHSNTRWLHELFEGTLTSETRCLTCENVSHRDEPFLDLSVDLEQHSSVTACLRRFSEEEMLCERNKFHCDNCGGLQEAEKRMKIKRLPRILALHLKRFKYTEDLQRLQKLFHKVVYPYHLRLFNTTDDAEDPDRIYELYAVVVHIGGGPYHGHYVAVIKTQDRGWLLFDDEMVEPVDKNFVRNFFGDKPGLACAYVLFYQETTIEAIRKEQQMEGKRRASQDLPNGLASDARHSAELHRIQTVNPMASPESVSNDGNHHYATLDHAMTAPEFMPNGHVQRPQSPTLTSDRPVSPVIQSKKEKAREEKLRKATEKQAEKERQEAERQRRKDLAAKLSEAHKKQEAELKAALEASKASKAEEDKRHALERSTTSPNGSHHSGLDRFKRSKSLRFGSLTKRDKPYPKPSDENLATSSASAETDTPDLEKDNHQDSPPKEKKNRFSIRKKSFGMLS
ncbi:hypothetical protein PV08_00683 [Exophiala spinifera]|uniref:Ubiquitin carboxyl-terminal hydrolase n=1 Tax=Exophiala spinifera TaxID=91928 RepID=A0A0D2BMF0_9EURO|nr:uncharacterized protein PV08_00683 [Exophiala spinifera]KIW20108.1 hypothetical protein PV08_00683 [Exophiala spinifera]